MVKLEAIEDEHFVSPQAGPNAEDDDGNYTDTDSSISGSETSSLSDADSIANETFSDRLHALQDIIPPSQRRRLHSAANQSWSWLRSSLRFSGNAAWYLSASALFFVVPAALTITEDLQMGEMEREMRIQQGINEVVTPEAAAGEGKTTT